MSDLEEIKEIKEIKEKVFQKVIDGEFVPSELYMCGNFDCNVCEFRHRCEVAHGDLVIADVECYDEYKLEYPEYFI